MAEIQQKKYILVRITIQKLKFPHLFLGILCGSICGCGNSHSLNWPQVLKSVQNEFPEIRQLSTQNLDDWIKDDTRPAPIIFDTREKHEYAISHLPNAKNLLPKSDHIFGVKGINKNASIVVYCSVGYRSSLVAQKLQKLGYLNVFNLEGSIFKWANEGREIVRSERPVAKVHPYNTWWGQLLDKRFHP